MYKYHKSCSQLIWPFYGLLQLYELKIQKFRIFASSVQKYHKSCFYLILPFYGLLQPFELDLRKLITPRVQYTGITNRVLSLFDCFTPSYNCMSLSIKKLITPQV